ncbi:ATP-binding protein [Ruminococcaceae bacterium OttesenSCG-928-I18]|nr:ATP-binding protein [Ruminococcaceae bacterium OttesenSCG-928-I18]
MSIAEMAEVTELGTYLSRALTTPLGIPAMLILVDQWRFTMRSILRIGAILVLFLFSSFYLIYQFFGVNESTVFIVAWVTPVICWAAFIVCCRFRDGRLLFSIITALLLAFVTESIASMLTPHDSLLWVLYKIALTVVQVLLLVFFARKPFLWMLKAIDKGWAKMSLVPLSLLLCLMFSYLRPMFRDGIYPNPIPTLILCVAMLLIYMSLYSLIKNITNQDKMRRDIDLLHTQMHFMEQQAKILQVNDHDNRTFRHNLRHYLGMLQVCADAGNIRGIQELIDNMEASFYKLKGHYGLQNYTGQPVIDAVLSFAAQQAQLGKIKYSAQVVLPANLRVDMVQLAVVLSNALENALHSCQNVPEEEQREIVVHSEVRKEQFYLGIRNSICGEVTFDAETGFPITDKAYHGYGTQTMEAFAQEYDAIFDFHTEDNWFYFGLLL